MKKERDNQKEMSRRSFLKAAALTGVTLCVSPALEKVRAAEKAMNGRPSAADQNIPDGMAAVRERRTLGSGAAEFVVSAIGFGCMGLNYHRSDPNTPIEIVAETVAELVKEGKVRHFGLCEVNADTIRRAHSICPITAIQSEYHLMHRTVEESVLPLCRELGIGFVPYSPINRGFLGGLINEHTQFSPNDNRQTLPRFQPESIRKNLRIVEALNAFGRTRGFTPAQIALAWLMHKGDFIVPIPGTTKLSHLEENLRAADIVFTAEEMNELEASVSAIPVTGSRYDALQESKIQK